MLARNIRMMIRTVKTGVLCFGLILFVKASAVSAANELVTGKAFDPTTISPNGTSSLQISISNTGALAATAVAFTDTYPAGVVNAPVPAPFQIGCGGGTLIAAAGVGSLSFSGGSISAGGFCFIAVNVTSAVAGDHVNDLPAGTVTTTTPGYTSTGTSATLTVLSEPIVDKSFSPSLIDVGETSTLTITITNPNGSSAITGVAFTDTYPAGFENAAVPNAGTTCGGSVTAAAGGVSVALSGGSIPAASACTVTVDVTAATDGAHENTIPAGAVSSSVGSNTAPATATLTAVSGLTVVKTFTPSTIVPDGTSTLEIAITNPGASTATGVALTDTYPAGVVNATPLVTSTSGCAAGTVTAAAGGNSVAFSGGEIAAGETCSMFVDVTSAAPGDHVNGIAAGDVTSSAGSNEDPASATLSVVPAPLTVTKSFAPPTIAPGGVATLTITLSNSNSIPAAAVAFTDAYPAAVTNAAPTNAGTSCGGSVVAAPGGGSVALSGGTIPAMGNCSVTVDVTATEIGDHVNDVLSGDVTSSIGSNAFPASGTLSVAGPAQSGLTVTKTFVPDSIDAGGTSSLEIAITNHEAVTVTGVEFIDSYPAGVVNATPLAATLFGCAGGEGGLNAVAGGDSVELFDATIAAGATCRVIIDVTSDVVGVHVNSLDAGDVTSSIGSPEEPASGTLTVTGVVQGIPVQAIPTLSFGSLAALALLLGAAALWLLRRRFRFQEPQQ